MGVDASTSCTGYSIFEDRELIAHGAVRPKKTDDWRNRLMQEFFDLDDIISQYTPEKIYVEEVPKKPGANTLQKLGAIQGMILCLCARRKISPVFILPSDWRRKIGLFDGSRTGTHRDVLKEKAVNKANELFDLDLHWYSATSTKNEDDEAEAILIAYSQIIDCCPHAI